MIFTAATIPVMELRPKEADYWFLISG